MMTKFALSSGTDSASSSASVFTAEYFIHEVLLGIKISSFAFDSAISLRPSLFLLVAFTSAGHFHPLRPLVSLSSGGG